MDACKLALRLREKVTSSLYQNGRSLQIRQNGLSYLARKRLLGQTQSCQPFSQPRNNGQSQPYLSAVKSAGRPAFSLEMYGRSSISPAVGTSLLAIDDTWDHATLLAMLFGALTFSVGNASLLENKESAASSLEPVYLKQAAPVAGGTGGQTTQRWYYYKGPLPKEHLENCNIRIFACQGQVIANDIAKYLGVKLGDMEVGSFADGETKIVINESVRGKDLFVVCSTTSQDRLMELLLASSAARRGSAKKITAVIPFYGYSRGDRVAAEGETVAASDIARMLEVVGVNHVITVDLHTGQTEGFFDLEMPVDNIQAVPLGAAYMSEQALHKPIVIAAHENEVHRAKLFQRVLGELTSKDGASRSDVGLAMIVRGRKSLQQVELVGDVEGRDCIIVDDIVDTGKTLLLSAKLLKEKGARKVYAFIIHPRLSGQTMDTIEKSEALDKLVVLNTILPPPNYNPEKSKVVFLSLAALLAELVKTQHLHGSITNVFSSN